MKEVESIDAKATTAGTWYTLANMLLKGCIFLSLPIFTRLLSTADFGIYNTYIAYESLITAVLGLGLYGTVKNAKLDFKESFSEYLSSVVSMSVLGLILVTMLANLLYPLYAEFIGFSRFIVNFLLFQSFGSYLIYFYGAKLNIEFKYKSYILISCFNTLGNIFVSVLLIVLVFPHERYLGRILGSAIPLMVTGILIILILWLQGKSFYNRKYWKYAIALGLPLVPHVVSQSLLSQFDRIMINNMVSSSASGIYSYIYTICTIMYVICTSFDNAWTPWVFLTLNKGSTQHIRSASKKYVSFFALLTLGFICVMPEVTKLIANNSYWSGIDLLIPLSLSNFYIFLYMLPVNIEYFNKKTKFISIGTVLAAVVNVCLNYIGIKYWGYKSAAYTTLISYILLFLFHGTIAKKYNFLQIYDVLFLVKISVFLMTVSFLILWLSAFYFIGLIVRYVIVVCILVAFFLNRKMLLTILIKK